MHELNMRLKKIGLLKEKVDGILLFNTTERTQSAFVNDPNFFYFTNSNVIGAFYYNFSEAEIFTNIMEEKRAKKFWVKDIQTGKLSDFIKKMKGEKIGIDKENLSANIFEKLNKEIKCTDISEEILTAREIKTENEIKNIKNACKKTCKIFKKIRNEMPKTENELKNKIYRQIIKYGEPAFPVIVASGRNIEIPHHTPLNEKLGKTYLVDFGVRINGYCSDFTRTFESRYEEIIKEIFAKIEDMLQPGTKIRDLDDMARKHMKQHSKYFITSLGHGIGIEVHEKPFFSKDSNGVLKENMVIAIEPGIYVKNGIRVENNYVITKNGFRCLTKI